MTERGRIQLRIYNLRSRASMLYNLGAATNRIRHSLFVMADGLMRKAAQLERMLKEQEQ